MTDGAALASKGRNLGTGFKNFIKDPKKSVMGFLKPGGKKGILGKSGAVGDGRFKTRGSLLEKTIDSLDTAAKKMNRSMMEKAPFHVLIKQTTNGINSLEIVKNEKSRFFSKGGEGSSGKKSKGEGKGKLDRDLAKAYLRDIESKTGLKVHKKQIDLLKDALRNNTFEKLTPKETAKHRSKFTSSLKDKLIEEWEEKTKQKWPRYTEEGYDKNGEIARNIGQPYDAHHLIENNFGGPHEWWNIHPAKYPNEHQAGIHGKGSPSGKLFPRR